VASSPYPYANSGRGGGGKVVAIVLGVGVVLFFGFFAVIAGLRQSVPSVPSSQPNVPGFPAAGAPSGGPVVESSGTNLFTDDFNDSTTGWQTGRLAHSEANYAGHGYQLTVTGNVVHVAWSPYGIPVAELRQTAIATSAAGSSPSGSWGLVCGRDLGRDSELHYEFKVNARGEWRVDRREGVPSLHRFPTILQQGRVAGPVTGAATVTAMCLTAADLTTVRLMMFVNGLPVTDFTNTASASTDAWRGGLIAAAVQGGHTDVVASHYNAGRVS